MQFWSDVGVGDPAASNRTSSLLVFSGTPRDGHGHHQAFGDSRARRILLRLPTRTNFQSRLKYVEPWQTKECSVARWNLGPVEADAADKNPPEKTMDVARRVRTLLGHSYTEIAGMSRSMHRSQGMGPPSSVDLNHLACADRWGPGNQRLIQRHRERLETFADGAAIGRNCLRGLHGPSIRSIPRRPYLC